MSMIFGSVDRVLEITQTQYMDVVGGFGTRINANLPAYANAGYQFAANDGAIGLRYQW